MWPKRSRWAGFVAGGPRWRPRRRCGGVQRPRNGPADPKEAGGGAAASRGARPAGTVGCFGPGRASPRPAGEIFSKILLASPSEFPYSTSSHGGVAQLGERLTGSQEVRGSIPLVSTRALNEAPTQVGAFFHIGTQGQRRHHDPPGRQDLTLNGRRVHGSISRRGSRCVACSDGLYHIHHVTRALGATVSAGDS